MFPPWSVELRNFPIRAKRCPIDNIDRIDDFDRLKLFFIRRAAGHIGPDILIMKYLEV
jgi:hypothetical protein